MVREKKFSQAVSTLHEQGMESMIHAVLKVDGLPSRIDNKELSALFEIFGFVVASTCYTTDKGHHRGLVKFAIAGSVLQAMEAGMTAPDNAGQNIPLTLAAATDAEDASTKLRLKNLDLIVRGKVNLIIYSTCL